MASRLGRVTVKGLGSIRGVDLDLSSGITVLIGANGSGKSTLVGALEIVARVWDGTIQDYLYQRGGISNLLFEGRDDRAERVVIEILPEPDEGHSGIGYHVELTPDALGEADEARIRERRLHLQADGRVRPDPVWLLSRGARGSAIHSFTNSPVENMVEGLVPLLQGCRVFHFDDVSHDAPVKGASTVGDDLALRSNAENIAAYLFKVRRDHPRSYRRIVEAVRHVTPFFDDFVLEPQSNERIRLRWRQRGLERTFLAREASDGTLRLICLVTLLLGPDLPATVVLDEPELGLHPAAVVLLADLIRLAGKRGHTVILATQSVPLVSQFALEEIVVLDRVDGATRANRPDAQKLSAFLEDYSTGSLWEMNLLGGHPDPEGAGADSAGSRSPAS